MVEGTEVKSIREGSTGLSILVNGKLWTRGEINGSVPPDEVGDENLFACDGSLQGIWRKLDHRLWGTFWKQGQESESVPSHNPMEKRIGEDGEPYTRTEFHQFFGCQEGERQWLEARRPGTGKGPGGGNATQAQ